MGIGRIIAFPGNSVPFGFLECDGSAVSRTDYADLFAIVGTSYGAGDGSTTFNLPNLSGKAVLGVSQAHALGSSGGEEEHTISSAETPEHSHEVPTHTHGNTLTATTPQLSHTITQPVMKYTRLDGNTGNGGAGSLVSRYNGRSNATMSRATSLAVGDHAETACTVTGGIADCAAMDTGSTGAGGAHNNMMPYLSLRYCICYYEGEPIPPTPSMLFYNGAMVATAGGGYIAGRL